MNLKIMKLNGLIKWAKTPSPSAGGERVGVRGVVLLALLLFFRSISFAQERVQAKSQPDADTGAYTLQRCIAITLQNNLTVNQAQWQSETNRTNLTSAWGNMLPNVAGQVSHGINQGRSINPYTNNYINQEISFANYNLNGSMTLFNGLSLQNAVHQSNLAYEAGKMDIQQAKENITISVMLAYMQVLSADEQLGQARRQQVVTERQVERLQVQNENGSIAPALLYDLKGQLAGDQLNVLTARSNAQTARLTLAQLMVVNFDPNAQFGPLPDALIPEKTDPNADRILLTAITTLPQIKAVDLRLRSARKGVLSAKALYSPSLYAFGNLGSTYSSAATLARLTGTTQVETGTYILNGADRIPVYTTQSTYDNPTIPYSSQLRNNVFSTMGLGVSIPLMSNNQNRVQVSRARISEEQANYQAKAARTLVQQAVEQAVLNKDIALERYNSLLRQVDDFTQSFQATEARFNAGLGTSVEYMVAKNNVDRARSNLIAARYDIALRSKIVEYYQGKPLL